MNVNESEQLNDYLYILNGYKSGKIICRRHNGFEYKLNNLKDILYYLDKTPKEVYIKTIFEI